jgi:spore coat polysaccharide biosynthesis predicted glycosyltransferase SpsG
MGHLFRGLHIIQYLKTIRKPAMVFINENPQAIDILQKYKILFEIVNLEDVQSDWETEEIRRYGIELWINDRLDTVYQHAVQVKKNGIGLITFDDRGTGAQLADLNVAALVFENRHLLRGRKILSGAEYLVLNDEIDTYKKLRKVPRKILVTLGGSDTYGVTVKVVDTLKAMGRPATIIVGPSFQHHVALNAALTSDYTVKSDVPSLIAEFAEYDLAITGGGITPFEANASGLPCIVIANELHEIEIGKYLESLGCSIFGGYYQNMDMTVFEKISNLEQMSAVGLKKITTAGVKNIFGELAICNS